MNNKYYRYLESIGKSCFKKYFDLFSDEKIPNKLIIDEMHNKEKYTLNSCRTRTYKARWIIRNIDNAPEDIQEFYNSCRKIR
ncbi:hypothetical protein FHQ18_09615 [Deferribacter autotrophicus]|uniref:Uncharacterized protein n=1 Tax=Deferribacter autotrophicus TaxID=500465 RepID=A0A5A8F1J3_9BACT|nr:hypothetical protein [Deferribacter autotrophicus]KAA0257297.1 hypothetical protein FHQ18_09615 [Deferribacter autotrophicus]